MITNIVRITILFLSILRFLVESSKISFLDFPESGSMTVTRKVPGSCGETTGSVSTRFVQKNFLSNEEVDFILDVTERGMKEIKDTAGPTILDPDTLLVLGPGAKLKRVPTQTFSRDEVVRYQELMKRMHQMVVKVHSLTDLYHTAPTFIARLRPLKDGKTAHVHDEYWHLHCDKNNTEHYDYSALVYLSDAGKDFEGGLFEFHDDQVITKVKPEKGMFITFASSLENAHRVDMVTKGTRYAWSTWWTCDPTKKLENSRLNLNTDNLSEKHSDL